MTSISERDLWSEGSLADLGTVERGRSRHRPRNDPALFGGPYPFFQTGDIKAADLRVTAFQETYNETGLAQSRLWPVGTLCITIAANIADAALLGVPGCFPDSVVGFTSHPGKSDVVFVKYLLDHIKHRFESISRGTTQDNLSLEKLLSLPIRYPPLGHQSKIAAILSAYDDLIETNNLRIKVLEEMARRIYQEWFVDLRYPGHENVPFMDSELGPIPEHWSVTRLGDAIELVYGKALKGDARRNGTVTVFGSGGVIGVHDQAIAEGPGIIVGRKGNVGSVFWSDGAFFAIDTTYWVRSGLPLTYCYYALREMDFLDSHAAVPGLSREQAYSLPLLVPDPDIAAKFDVLALELFALRRWLANTIDNLRAARGLLLPRLISGEIDVTDLNIAMPEAAA